MRVCDLARVVMLSAAVLAGSVALASDDTDCEYDYRVSASDPWSGTGAQACQVWADRMEVGGAAAGVVNDSVSASPNGAGNYTCHRTFHSAQYPEPGGLEQYDTTVFMADPDGCSAQCDGSITGETFSSAGTASTLCDETSNCRVTRTSDVSVCLGETCYSTYTGTGETCSSEPQGTPTDEGEGCITSGGQTFCKQADQPSNCGWLNDQWVCLGETTEASCQALADGSRVCGNRAPVPPVPDSGTAGIPATPDMQITVGDTEINYYSSTTVNNSSRDPGAASGDGSNPYADTEDGGQGTGQGGDGKGLTCDPGSDTGCTGEGDGEGHEGDITDGWQCWAETGSGDDKDSMVGKLVGCFSEAGDKLAMKLQQESPLLALVADVTNAVPVGGECPSADFDVWGISGDWFAIPCDLLNQYRGMLSAIWLVVWSFFGLRILLTIPGE